MMFFFTPTTETLKFNYTIGKDYQPVTVNFYDEINGNILLHIDFRFNDSIVVINNRIDGVWGEESSKPLLYSGDNELSIAFADKFLHVGSNESSCLITLEEKIQCKIFCVEFTDNCTNLLVDEQKIQAKSHSLYSHYLKFNLADNSTSCLLNATEFFDKTADTFYISELKDSIVSTDKLSSIDKSELSNHFFELNFPDYGWEIMNSICLDDSSTHPVLVKKYCISDIRGRIYQMNDIKYCSASEINALMRKTHCDIDVIKLLYWYLTVRHQWGKIVSHSESVISLILSDAELFDKYAIARLEDKSDLDDFVPYLSIVYQNRVISKFSYDRHMMHYHNICSDKDELSAHVNYIIDSTDELMCLNGEPSVFEYMSPHKLTCHDDEIFCVIVARNEHVRLVSLLEYYRDIGVDKFILIDNASQDETISHFRHHPDVFIFKTAENYRDSRYGVKWHNEICDNFLSNKWVLTVDADEMLVYPGSEDGRTLKQLRDDLIDEGAEGLFTPMIDMYADKSLHIVEFQEGDSLIEKFPCFDGVGYRMEVGPSFPRFSYQGGVRIRKFFKNFHTKEVPSIALQKVPFVKWKDGFRYLSSTHECTPLSLSKVMGALLHFKFLPDFHEKAILEVQRSQHYEGAKEYRKYVEYFQREDKADFVYEHSLYYKNPDCLMGLGLISNDRSAVFEKYSSSEE